MVDGQTTILNDKAIELLEHDALDFRPYVRALAKIVMSGSTPLTIGVFGDWGSGKTSLMRMVKEQVEARGAVTGWFDAWKYDKEETLWRAFLLAVLSAVRNATPEGQTTQDLDYLETMLYRPIDIEKAGGVTIDLAKLGGSLAQGAIQLGLSFIPGGTVLSEFVKKVQELGAEALTDDVTDAIQRERTKIHIEQVRFLEQFQDKFRALVQQHVINNGQRLVIFVDDLDRCLPEKAIEVLEAIKLFVDAPGCIFMLGLDQQVIARGVELRYRDFARDGRQVPIDGAKYLEKIIQLPFQIPPVARDDMGDFVHGLSQDWPHAECPKVFAEGLGNNPRQIKRTVNVFLMLWSLADERKDKLEGVIKPVRLAKVVALQTAAPALYNVIKEQPGLLRDLENYFLAEAASTHEALEGVKATRLSASELRSELPDDLARLVSGIPAVQRILTVQLEDKQETRFIEISPADLRPYFTLTRRAEAPQVGGIEATRLLFEPQMVAIPFGKFIMGSSTSAQAADAVNDGSINWAPVEQPQHEVELSAYAISKYPVTNREYQAFVKEMGDTHHPRRGWDGDQYLPEKGDYPVVNISWGDAAAYCRWLCEKTGKPYRLPTEAEWEKAARGEDGRTWPWGNTFDSKNANTAEVDIGDTTPVGQFSPQGDSPYGCADMIGNVWEWCLDWLDENEYKSRQDGVRDPGGPKTGNLRILRGGSFGSNLSDARCAFRYWYNPFPFSSDIGFRVVVSPLFESKL